MENSLSQDWRREHDYSKVYEYLHDFVGCSRNQRLSNDLADFLYFAKLDWAAKNRVKFSSEVLLVTVCEPSTNEILEIGGTVPGDIFTDFIGQVLGLWFQTPINNTQGITATSNDIGNTIRTFRVWTNATGGGVFSSGGTSEGTQMQLGTGTTAPTRADVAITTAFGTAPESGQFSTGGGSYGGGTTTVSGSLTSGGVGTVNEGLLIHKAADTGAALRQWSLAHDLTTATPFIANKSITAQWSITN